MKNAIIAALVSALVAAGVSGATRPASSGGVPDLAKRLAILECAHIVEPGGTSRERPPAAVQACFERHGIRASDVLRLYGAWR